MPKTLKHHRRRLGDIKTKPLALLSAEGEKPKRPACPEVFIRTLAVRRYMPDYTTAAVILRRPSQTNQPGIDKDAVSGLLALRPLEISILRITPTRASGVYRHQAASPGDQSPGVLRVGKKIGS